MKRHSFKARILAAGLCAALLSGAGADAADNPFARPPEFEPDIRFWTRIYTEVGTDGGLLHDERHLGVVYEAMKFPADLAPAERSRRITAAKDKYRSILNRLAAGQTPEDEAQSENDSKRVRALWPKDVNSRALKEAAERIRFQLGQANRFREGIIRAGAYEAHIAETLANMGLPPELAALPHVESSFDPRAYSHAGAAGLWQFIRSTGRRYMRIDTDVDERMDPYRSTVAAAQFLKFNYELLGSWPLALTAYNHGPAGMRRAKERMGTDDIVAISRKYQSRTFGFASRNYYIAFLAALDIDRNVEKYFGPIERHTEIKTRVIALPAYIPVAALERSFSIERELLRSLNPSLTAAVWRGERYVPRGFELQLPDSLFANLDPGQRFASLSAAERFDSQKPERFHRVARGETLSGIAAKHGTTVAALLRTNGLRNARSLRRGQQLRLPEPAARAPEPPVVVAAAPKPEAPRPVPPPAAVPPAPAKTPVPIEPEEIVVVSDKYIERVENAEPVSEAQAEAIGPQLVASEQSALSADPSDYTIAEDLTIEVQAAETLGHYAEWLDIRASDLRKLNRMRGKQPVVVGHRLKIDLAQVSVDEFERRRRTYHQALQAEFFAAYRIARTEVHVVRRGESLWLIAQKYPNVPIWLLRQHNPDIDFGDVRPKTALMIPLLESAAAPQSARVEVP